MNNKFKKFYLIFPFLILSILFTLVPLILIIVISLTPSNSANISENWNILNPTIFEKIFKSFYIAISATFFCVIIAYSFSYILLTFKSKTLKRLLFSLITMPIWLGSLILLISLKSFLDKIGNSLNSTYGDIFSIIGIVYLYLPYMIIPIYNNLEGLPKNLINASKDLGRNNFVTFFKVILPYSKNALISGIVLVLLPAISCVAIPQFLNNSNNGQLIGGIIMDQGIQGIEPSVDGVQPGIALSRACVLSLVVSFFMLIMYILIISIPKLPLLFQKYKSKLRDKNVQK